MIIYNREGTEMLFKIFRIFNGSIYKQLLLNAL